MKSMWSAPGPTSIAPSDRLLRLGVGAALLVSGLVQGSWILMAAGALLGFLGVCDRCPLCAVREQEKRAFDPPYSSLYVS
jgi:hypothetical protein